MKERARKLPSPALVISVLALFVALGGTVYAAGQINGNTIKKASIPGNRLKNDTVTGTQVKESSLATVPSATDATNASHAASATTATNATNATNATTAANANALSGLPASSFEPRTRWAIVDATGATGTASILAQSGGISVASDIGIFTYLNFGSSQANTHILTSYGKLSSDDSKDVQSGVCGAAAGGPGGVGCVVLGTNNPNHIVVEHDTDSLYYIVVSPN